VWDSVGASVRASVRARVGDSVWARVRARVGDSVWARVRARVGDSVWAYVGYIFAPCVSQWRSTKHQKGEYPFQPAVDLWKIGLVPSFDGAVWRLHGGPNAAVLWTGTV